MILGAELVLAGALGFFLGVIFQNMTLARRDQKVTPEMLPRVAAFEPPDVSRETIMRGRVSEYAPKKYQPSRRSVAPARTPVRTGASTPESVLVGVSPGESTMLPHINWGQR